MGSVLKTSREQVFLASKAGMYKNPDGSREIDGDPDRIIRSCDESLSRLGTDVIDLFYLHRVDHRVPVEESVGAIDQLISQGKVRYAGLSRLVSQPRAGQVSNRDPRVAVRVLVVVASGGGRYPEILSGSGDRVGRL